MSATIRKAYIITCDHVAEEDGRPVEFRKCGWSVELGVPDSEEVTWHGTAAWVRKRLRQLKWKTVAARGYQPKHFCEKHQASAAAAAAKINNEER